MRTATIFVLLLTAAPAAAQNSQPPLISLAPPGPALGPKTVLPASIACTDAPVSAEPSSPLRIVAQHGGDAREFSYRNDVVVLNGGTPEGLVPGQRFFTRRFRAPRNGETVSAKDRGSVRTSGWLTVIAADEHSALARVDYACDGIASGDYLDAYVEPTLPAEPAAARQSDFTDMAHVLSGVDRRESFGAGDILSIDRGSSRGLTAGMRIAFYRDRQNATPLIELGTGIVLEVAAETAKVVIEKARMAVTSGDYVAIRQP